MANTASENSMIGSMSRRRFVFAGTAATFAALGLAGCGGSGSGSRASAGAGSANAKLKDGSYTGQSSTLDEGVDGDGYGIIVITIENGEIVDAAFQAFEPDGTVKDENYGKRTSAYGVAQKALSAGDSYVKDLIESGSIEGVDAISGATYLYEQFVEASEDALKQASN